MNDNMKFYEAMRAVPKEAQKSFSNGKFSGTDINPQWRLKKLTEVFGPAGIGWYTEVVSREMITAPDGKTMCTFIGINLFVKVDGEWSKPIYGEGGNTFVSIVRPKQGEPYLSITDEAFKMAYTDAISNAAKALGCGADIWFEKDRTKYDLQQERAQPTTQPSAQPTTQPTTQPAAQPTPTAAPAITDMDIAKIVAQANACKTADEVMKIYNDHKELWSNEKFSKPIIAIGKAKREQEKGGAA
jgi:hypothetical protein